MDQGKRFVGRKAVVTGGASGIGLGVCRRLIAEGARVAIWDLDSDAIEAARRDLGSGAAGFQVDIADPGAVEKAGNDTAQALGGVDILVASAGITGPNTPLAEYPVDA